ncbi:Pr6Pr family membrane protein [Mucilaginibacter sp.]|uniref:Pr6Pr family membrane protein n=1 Tax=Mucilaginibacter sp. TaxID=1882438 RepID=UPI003263BEA1
MAIVKNIKTLAAILSMVAWFGVISQFYTSVPAYLAKGRTLVGTLVELFSFFTIQTNILAAICFTAIAVGYSQTAFFKRRGTLTSGAVNISIVALVFNLVLRSTYHPVGLASLSNELVHVITPALFIIYWLAFVPKDNINWKDGFSWLWYPACYLAYILIRGAICGLYPYFFLDTGKYGYPKVALNIGGLLIVFLIMDMLYIFIAKLINRYFGT